MPSKLPPLPEEAYDGDKSKVELKFERCSHKQIKALSGNEARCSCGAGFVGSNIRDLVNLLQNQ